MAEHREDLPPPEGPLNGGPGEATRRFVRWTLARGPWLWLVALALALPSTVALVRLYRNLTSEIEELLPRNAPSVAAVDELRRRLPGLSTLGVVVATSHPSELPAAERLIDELAARIRRYPPALVRAVKTGEEAATERRFLAAHLPLFVDVGDLVEIRTRVEEHRGWETRNRLGINFDDEQKPPPLDFSDIETKYQARFPGVRLPGAGAGAQSGAGAVTPERNRYSDEAGTASLLLIEGRESSLGAHQARPAPRTGARRTSRRWAGRPITRRGCVSGSPATSRSRSRSCRRCRLISESRPRWWCSPCCW